MRSLSKHRVIQVGIVLVFLLSVALLGRLTSRLLSARAASSSPLTAGVTLQCLGQATSFLVQPGRTWKVFSVSNGTSKTLLYATSGMDYRPIAAWVSMGWSLVPMSY